MLEALPQTLQTNLKIYLWILGITVSGLYVFFYASGKKIFFPGDYYRIVGPRRVYVPLGGTLIVSLSLYIILTTKLWMYILMFISIFVIYRLVFKKKL
ncbi:hypothetical protein A2714_01135 [Candidatus Woesebacteria bacterium RIFCSPHIGHO2_01_FULL_38_9]|uniref:Uncharacterized protein n=2 Tax=Candidatus Woeseibacteriota TaxID=1752722 RepID=A0A1F7Y0Z0_9BACT|nr:MAG: hypothetical protein A2714_01135 [Candidatus Woesebacteria bacterium RIFCSPHIGHO2_01_FULL_38_9]OGM59425.1 MAG: hypothetical protein A3A75_06085 [Candidatus Woesebacteria bacterium RIFCSPLOWO2_01_FULL_39_10]